MHQDFLLFGFVFVLEVTNSNAWAPPETVSSSFSRRHAPRKGQYATWRYQHSFKGAVPIEGRKPYREFATLLLSDSNENDATRPDEDPDKDVTNTPKKKYTSARMGGRKRKIPRRDSLGKKDDKDDNLKKFTKWATVLAPILLLWVLIKSLLFGGSSSEPSYVYYQSSVYESRTYGADGRVDTSRKESFRSNIPSLIEGKRLQQEPRGSSSYLLQQNPDESFERELDSMLQLQESIVRDFFR